MACLRAANTASSEHIMLIEKTNGSVSSPSPTTTTTTSGHSTSIRPTLSHIDFWPACVKRAFAACDATFEYFDVLVERANRWMKQFLDFELINCETVEKKVIDVQDIYSASTCYLDDPGTMATFIKGLRLWYRHRRPNSAPYSALDFIDIMPQYLNPGEKQPQFESLEASIDKANAWLRQYPVQGSILAIETVSVRIPNNDWCSTIKINSRQCYANDEYSTHQISFLRLFYLSGAPKYELIGLRDFTPEVLDEGGIFQPAKYSPFSALVEKASEWVKQATNHGRRCDTDKLFECHIQDRFRMSVLRVGFSLPMAADIFPPGDAMMPELTCRTYFPRKRRGTYENITEILERIEAVINYTNAQVFHVETAAMPEWMTDPNFYESGDRTFYDGDWYFISDKDGNIQGPYRHTVIYAIRVYFDGQFQDPPFCQMPNISPPKKGCCRVM